MEPRWISGFVRGGYAFGDLGRGLLSWTDPKEDIRERSGCRTWDVDWTFWIGMEWFWDHIPGALGRVGKD